MIRSFQSADPPGHSRDDRKRKSPRRRQRRAEDGPTAASIA
jgi:hypothetical protein